MEQLLSFLKEIPEYRQVLETVMQGKTVGITGVSQINRSHVIAGLCAQTGRPVTVICQDDLAAKRLQEEVKAFLIALSRLPGAAELAEKTQNARDEG